MLICTKMKQVFAEKVEIPEGVVCTFEGNALKCKKGPKEVSKKMDATGVDVKVDGNVITFSAKAGNKNQFKTINSFAICTKNMFNGLDKEYVYNLEACNVHFPMSLKIEGSRLKIDNFLGEKVPRYSDILPNVKVDIKGVIITISSFDKEAAGQTAANMEKATKITKRDRRVFQDGIFITEKPSRETGGKK